MNKYDLMQLERDLLAFPDGHSFMFLAFPDAGAEEHLEVTLSCRDMREIVNNALNFRAAGDDPA